MKLIVGLALLGLVFGKDDCPAWRAMSDESECVWPRNDDGHMSARPLMDAFIDKCKIDIDWKGKQPPDITDKHQIPMPEKCGHCAFKIKCANRERKDGCFPIKAEKITCNEHGDVCEMPKTPKFNNCRWSMLGAFMTQCVTSRPDLAPWRREGYHQGGRFFPQQNCLPDGDKCRCCCHPYRPVKDGDGYKCAKADKADEAEACPDFADYNDWSQCLWYPLSNVAKEVNDHCNLQDLMPKGFKLKEMIEKRIAAEEKDPNRAKVLAKLPKDKCGYCSFKMRCRKRAHTPVCFGFDGDKKACGPDDCDGCGEPCEAAKLDNDMPKVPSDLVGTCNYAKYILGYLKSKAMPFMKNLGNNYWKKRGFAQLMKFLPMGKCVETDGKCKCCCHPYVPSEDGSKCELRKICRLPHDMGLQWDTTA